MLISINVCSHFFTPPPPPPTPLRSTFSSAFTHPSSSSSSPPPCVTSTTRAPYAATNWSLSTPSLRSTSPPPHPQQRRLQLCDARRQHDGNAGRRQSDGRDGVVRETGDRVRVGRRRQPHVERFGGDDTGRRVHHGAPQALRVEPGFVLDDDQDEAGQRKPLVGRQGRAGRRGAVARVFEEQRFAQVGGGRGGQGWWKEKERERRRWIVAQRWGRGDRGD